MNRTLYHLTALLGLVTTITAQGMDPVAQALQNSFIWRGVTETSAGYTVFRKTFSAMDVSAATLNLFADARYVLWVNGQYVQRGPCRFDPAGPEYDALNVAPFLVPGTNTLAVMVMSYPTNSSSINSKMKRHVPGLTAWLRVGLGANVMNVLTDATWKWKNNLRYKAPGIGWGFVNDTVDARLDDGDWTRTNYNDSAWTAAAAISGAQWGALQARTTPLQMEQDVTVSGATFPISLTGSNVVYFTLPQMVQGYFEIDVGSATAGSSIGVMVSERGSTNSISMSDNYGSVFSYTSAAGRLKCFCTDTMGFHYLQITNMGGSSTIYGVRVVDHRYPYTNAGSFSSSDPWLNDLWGRAVQTIRMCASDGYMDCTLRERAEWMGDSAVVEYPVSRVTLAGPVVAGQPLASDSGLVRNMIRHIAESGSQLGDGRLKAHACSDRFDIHGYIEDYSCLWVQALRQYYENTGDTNLINEVWPALTGQMQWFLDRRSAARGLVFAREFVIFDNPLKYVYCEGATLNAFIYRALLDSAELGNAIGQGVTASNYLAAAGLLQTNYNLYLWDSVHGTYYGGLNSDGSLTTTNSSGGSISPTSTCHAAILALDRGIVLTNRLASVQQYFLSNYAAAVSYPYTAFWVLNNLYSLDDSSHDLEAVNYIRNQWSGVMQRTDTGTLTETFNGGEACHNFGASAAYFLSSYILGVRLDGPALNRKLIVEPRLSWLTSAQGNVVTELGVVPVSWSFTNGQFALNCTIPNGATATLRISQIVSGVTPDVVLDGLLVTNTVASGRYAQLTIGSGAHQVTAQNIRRWKGDGLVNVWDVNTNANWLTTLALPATFLQNAVVSFDDTGLNSPAVLLIGSLSPAMVTVNASQNYTFAGSGSLNGAMTLVKSGGGVLAINTTNTWSGDILLQGGTVVMGNSRSLGVGGNLDFSGGVLAIASDLVSSHNILIASNAVAWIDTQGHTLTQSGNLQSLTGVDWGLTKAGAGALILQGAQSYAGPTLISAGTLQLGASTAPPAIAGLIYHLDASAQTTLALASTNVSAWTDVEGSGLTFAQSTATSQPVLVNNALNGKSVVRFGGAQKMLLSTATAPREIAAVTIVKGGVDGNIGGFLGINGADTGLRLNSSPGSWAADSASNLVNGLATTSYTANQAQIEQRYATTWGVWTATGFGQYFVGGGRYFNGDVAEILVYGSTLAPADRNNLLTYLHAKWLGTGYHGPLATLPTNTTVILASAGAALDLGGANQTISLLSGVAGSSVTNTGVLAINSSSNAVFAGSISGSGSFLKNGSGTLILAGTNTYTGPTQINGGSLVLDGSLTSTAVTIASNATLVLRSNATMQSSVALTNNGTLVLFTWKGVLPAGFVNHGTLTVISTVASNSTNVNCSISGGLLTLIWPMDHLGWMLQTQKNDFQSGLTTNWVDLVGTDSSTQAVVTINSTNGSVFFRLRHP